MSPAAFLIGRSKQKITNQPPNQPTNQPPNQPTNRLTHHRPLPKPKNSSLNETLLPLDHRAAGQIVDDELNARLVNVLPRGVKLHAVIDACHSGSVLDLPFTAALDPRGGGVRWESEYHHLDTRVAAMKGTSGGFAGEWRGRLVG